MSGWQTSFLSFFQKKRTDAAFQELDEAILPYAACALCPDGRPLMFIVPNGKAAEQLSGGIKLIADALNMEIAIELLPELPFGKLLTTLAESEFAAALHNLLTSPPQVVILAAGTFMLKVPPPASLKNNELLIKLQGGIKFTALIELLVAMDYDDEFEVSCAGEFSRRGGIIDIFSPAEDFPVRLEFWGDELESIRKFSPETQRTEKCIAEYRIIGKALNDASQLTATVADYADYLHCKVKLIYPELVYQNIQNFGGPEELTAFVTRFGQIPAARRSEWQDAAGAAGKKRKKTESFDAFPAVAHLANLLPDEVMESSLELVREQIAAQIKQWLNTGYKVLIGSKDTEAADHAARWLAVYDIPAGKVEIVHGVLPCGVLLPEEKLVFLNEKELFAVNLSGRLAAEAGFDFIPRQKLKIDDSNIMADLNEGDYAVHLTHGIGRFKGLRILAGRSSRREVMVLEYADDKLLYVPLYQAHLVSKYLGAAGKVTLHRLNSKKWINDKIGAMKSVREYAADLLRMQAVRYSVKNLPLPPEDYEQLAFENSFDFELTIDQKRSVNEIKADLSGEHPMDRLLCGDVGFGKTEVAIQAAFRMVYAGYQVAVLAPTTVLAQQHFYSFQERFARYGIHIDMVSRFRSAAEQHAILRKMAAGQVDIIIGTHRLCNADVKFANLGLVIIDEEQRFGVKHKERLRQLRTDVNVLTMSATPIPRTLYMAMAGARDLSTIMTPPRARLPVKTIICDENDGTLLSTINAELLRGGQVYYLYNRVKTIQNCADKLRRNFPKARIEIAHGQMAEDDLEMIMARFLNGEIDILVCTTIIESGMDVRNANTIVIERADRFGLAELYQLRGRVGRWINQAYACMMVPKTEIMTLDGRKRIAAIRRYTHLGAGFQLALRDLEIRGAGNLLGQEQSGHVKAIGFELYCQLLSNEVRQLKGEKVEFLPEVDLAIEFVSFAWEADAGLLPAALPPSYIESERLRVEAYRKLSRAASETELQALKEEFTDRYGKLPVEAENLFTVTLVRILAARRGYVNVCVADGGVWFRTASGQPFRIEDKLPYIAANLSPLRKLMRLVEFARKLQ